MSPILRLPDEVLLCIADAVDLPRALMGTCRRFHDRLWGCFLRMTLHPQTVDELCDTAQDSRRRRVRRLEVHCRGHYAFPVFPLGRVLAALPKLQSVTVQATACALRDVDMNVFAALPLSVRSLRLFLGCNALTDLRPLAESLPSALEVLGIHVDANHLSLSALDTLVRGCHRLVQLELGIGWMTPTGTAFSLRVPQSLRRLRVCVRGCDLAAGTMANMVTPQITQMEMCLSHCMGIRDLDLASNLSPNLRRLRLILDHTLDQAAATISALGSCTALEVLHLVLNGVRMQRGSASLGALLLLFNKPQYASRLAQIALVLHGTHITGREARALAEALSRRHDTLRSLHIDVRGNQIGTDSVFTNPWLPLRECRKLDSLVIIMDDNELQRGHFTGTLCIGSGLPLLQELRISASNNPLLVVPKQMPSLRSASHLRYLEVDLSNTGIGVRGLAALWHASKLEQVFIGAIHCGLSDRDAYEIAKVHRLERVHTLVLRLGHNHLTRNGMIQLARLGACPALTDLTLSVRDNPLQAGSVDAFLSSFVFHSTELVRMNLELSNTGLEDVDFATIGKLGAMRSLTHCQLGLQSNRLGVRTVASLACLRLSERLQHLTLDMRNCHLTGDVTSRLGVLNTLDTLALQLDGNDGLHHYDIQTLANMTHSVGAHMTKLCLFCDRATGFLSTDPRVHVVLVN